MRDFIICLGYRGYVIKQYFANYILHQSNARIDLSSGQIEFLESSALPPWRITLVDTGTDTMTGGRLKRIEPFLNKDRPFCMTYGDGVADIDIQALMRFHEGKGLEATLTAVQPAGRFGVTLLNDERVVHFAEKPAGDGSYINGGFFVLEPSVLGRIKGDSTVWEAEPLEGLASDGQLGAYAHNGFWQPMDTLRDKTALEAMWNTGRAPWKTW
jgi:glucose-1-phosphate cytidylyltransferase